jgi:hypothetical protein
VTDFPQQKEWKVLSVREGKETDNPHGGKLKAFYVDFEGAEDVYWRRKMPAEVKAGEAYFGTISKNQYGLAFKKEKPEGSSLSAGSSNHSSGSRSYKPESEFDPEKVARIGRAHAQKCAVQLIGPDAKILENGQDGVPRPTEAFVALIDWFEADVDAAATRARGAAPATNELNGLRNVVESTERHNNAHEREKFRNLFELKALSMEASSKLADFTMRMNPEQRIRAWNGLGEASTEMETLKKLEDSFREVEGESLTDSAIPF